jgi:hypothetical protein
VIFPAGDTVLTAPNTAGVVQNDNLISFSFDVTPFTTAGEDLQNRVVKSNLLNTMVFSPRIRDTFNIATRGFEIIGFSLDEYAGWETDIATARTGWATFALLNASNVTKTLTLPAYLQIGINPATSRSASSASG